VEPEGHPRTITDDPVVELEAQFDPPFGRPAATGVEAPVAGVEHHRVVGSVELEIGGAHGLQLVGLLPEQLRDVGEELLEAPVVGRSALGIPEVREETGAGERDLQHPIRASTCVGELLGAEGTTAPQLPDHRQVGALDPQIADLVVAVPVAPQEGTEIPAREPVDGRRKLTLERQATHLAIGHDLDARLLLQAQGVVDGIVLDDLEPGGREPSTSELLARLEQARWAKQATDHVAASLHHQCHRTSWLASASIRRSAFGGELLDREGRVGEKPRLECAPAATIPLKSSTTPQTLTFIAAVTARWCQNAMNSRWAGRGVDRGLA
jgi:hypothetical protein